MAVAPQANGGLYSFTPDTGPMAGIAYPLPLVTKDNRYIETNTQVQRQASEAIGTNLGTGKRMQNPQYGVADVTVTLTPNIGLKMGYQTADLGGVMTAVADFRTYVTNGGTGTLRENLPPNTRGPTLFAGGFGSPVPGSIITFRTCTAIVNGEPTETPDGGVWTIDFQLLVPTCFWMNSDGSLTLFGW